MVGFKRPEFVEIDNPTRRPGVNSRKRDTSEASQVPADVVANAYPLGQANPNGTVAGQPYASTQHGVGGGNPIGAMNRLGGRLDRELQ